MKQAIIFVCAFSVLFQLYSGAYAAEDTDSSDSGTASTSLDTILDMWKASINSAADKLNSEQYAKLIAAAAAVEEYVGALHAKVNSSNFLSNVGDELDNLEAALVNGSYRDSFATAALIETLIFIVEANAITDLDTIKALIDAMVDVLDTDDTSSDSSTIEIIRAKVVKIIKIIYEAITAKAETITSDFRAIVKALGKAVSVEFSTTTIISKAWIALFKAIVG